MTTANAFAPQLGNTFDILDWGTLSGTFSTIQLPMLTDELEWDTSQLYLSGVLRVVGNLSGDYNQNGIVDAADYVVWRKSVSQMGTNLAADGNDNGQIDPGDYDVWRSHFGQAAGNATLSVATVPEPSADTLLLLFITGLLAHHTGRKPC